MSDTKRSRGRPKGSGIDDHGRLVEIGRLIRSNPGLKPTTAIRRLGYTDPSTVRRLRDKYNAQRETIIDDIAKMPCAAHVNDNTTFGVPTEAARAALNCAKDPVRRSPIQSFQPQPKRQSDRHGAEKDLSCLLAIGALALAQAAARCAEPGQKISDDADSESEALLANMLMMINPADIGDEPTARKT